MTQFLRWAHKWFTRWDCWTGGHRYKFKDIVGMKVHPDMPFLDEVYYKCRDCGKIVTSK